jgi:uncharacterized protein (TIGR03067 family)
MKRLLLVLAAGFLVAADTPQDPGANDLPKLQGAWTLVALEVNGEKQPPEKIKRTLVYAGHNWRVKVGDEEIDGSSKFDASKTPKAIDITYNTGPNKGKTYSGIYEIDGDTYRACVAPPGKDRPKEFVSKLANLGPTFSFLSSSASRRPSSSGIRKRHTNCSSKPSMRRTWSPSAPCTNPVPDSSMKSGNRPSVVLLFASSLRNC